MTSKEDLAALELSDSRIVLLYSTRQEGSDIMKWAAGAGLTGNSFVWVATQSVIGEIKEALPELPAGMLGKSLICSTLLGMALCVIAQYVPDFQYTY